MRYPLSALEEAAGLDKSGLAEALNKHYDQLRYVEQVGLTEEQADHFATKLGFHPGLVWQEWWDIELLTDEEMDALEEQKFCAPCGTTHPKTAFGVGKRFKDGRNSVCRKAINQRNKDYRASRGVTSNRELVSA